MPDNGTQEKPILPKHLQGPNTEGRITHYNDTGLSDKELRKLRKQAMAAMKDGISMESVNKSLRKRGVDGFVTLEQALGINPQTTMETIQGLGLSGLSGLMASFGDEALGLAAGMATGHGVGAAALPNPETYTAVRDEADARRQQTKRNLPKTAFAAEMAGALVPGALAGGIAAGAGVGAGPVGGAGSASLLSRAVGSGAGLAAMGGIEGTVYGAGESPPGLKNRLTGALVGGAIGTATGGMLGAGMPLLGAVGRNLTRGAEAVGWPGAAGVRQRDAQRLAGAAIEADLAEMGSTTGIHGISEKAASMRPGTVLADTDPMLGRMVRSARNQSPALDAVGGRVEAVRKRAAAAGNRVADILRNATGIARTENPDVVMDLMVDNWQRNVMDPFERQLGAGSEGTMILGGLAEELKEVFRAHPKLKEAFSQAGGMGTLNKDEGIDFHKAWQAMQDLGRQKSAAGTLIDDRRQANSAWEVLGQIMEDEVPGFAAVRAEYKAIFDRHDAYIAGGKAAPARSARDIKAEMRGMDPQAKEAYRAGFLDNIEEAMRRRKNANQFSSEAALGSDLTDGYQAERIQFLFDDAKGYAKWLDELNTEYMWGMTHSALTGNSTTAMQIADELGGVVTRAPSLLNEILVAAITDPTLRRRVATEIGEILLAEGPERALAAAAMAEQRKKVTRYALTGIMAGIGQGASIPAAQGGGIMDRATNR
jgi:hypothetical protein